MESKHAIGDSKEKRALKVQENAHELLQLARRMCKRQTDMSENHIVHDIVKSAVALHYQTFPGLANMSPLHGDADTRDDIKDVDKLFSALVGAVYLPEPIYKSDEFNVLVYIAKNGVAFGQLLVPLTHLACLVGGKNKKYYVVPAWERVEVSKDDICSLRYDWAQGQHVCRNSAASGGRVIVDHVGDDD